ncbi:DUF6452 family protein [Marinilabilia rubra]|uniref:Lipoprotein n=1 Tax=Marinilabilia rubra TaxID=2162893 RepID=A0A2U2B9E9_9BACT|nr:DUF6452 family protein [Marinilabilia rubra]PWD99672.1 hypothetical protein DDZ16_09515 [Marinilabilia rubra]
MKFRTCLLAVTAIVFITAGCENEEACLSNQHSVQAGFFSAWSQTDKDSTLNEVSLFGLEREDSIYTRESLSELFIPLDFERDTVSFAVVARTMKDTLRIAYQKELDFISRDCGYIFSFQIDTVWHSNAFIDSVAIEYTDIKYGETVENIKLYIY